MSESPNNEHAAAGQRFFVTLVSGYYGRAAEGASVRDAHTGEITDLVKPPTGGSFGTVTSCGESTYILTARPQQITTLAYRLRVGAAGQVAEYVPLPIDLLPSETRVIAANRGGTTLAYAAWDMRPPGRTAKVGLVDIVTSQRRLASVPPGIVRYLSLANDGQTLAFVFESRTEVAWDVYVAAAASSDWVRQGTRLEYPRQQHGDTTSPVISADGQMVYLTVRSRVLSPSRTGTGWWRSRPQTASRA